MTDVLFPMMSVAGGATGVIVTWFVESGDEVTPTTLIAEVAVDQVNVAVYPEDSGVITLLAEENREVRQGSV
jgi:pyruvate/2-oxoglutarate dehydrogenase complex dihydrolipoamide acyltransferase (E2) component